MFTMKNVFRSGRRLAAGLVLAVAVTLFAGTGALQASSAPAPAAQDKALVYAGWFGNTLPTPGFIAANKSFLETQPFNGLIVYLRSSSLGINASTGVMKNVPLSYDAIDSVLNPIKDMEFTQLKQNFGLVLGTTPPDFFDDWSTIVDNFANLARAAKNAGLKGIAFDNEQYFAPWGNYPTGVAYPGASLAQYQVQARLRGRQVMEAMVAEFPAIVVVTLHGPYVSEPSAPESLNFPQWQSGNELLGPFFAGFQEGSSVAGQNVDGGELYDLRSAEDFQQNYVWRRYDIASSAVNCAYIPSALRTTWADNISISFGVYDLPFGGKSMNPAILTTTLTNALATADTWVWFYAEDSTYLLPESQGGATDEWVDAVRAALPATSSDPSGSTPLGLGTASGDSGGGSSGSCGLLGIEVVPVLLFIGLQRGLKRRNRPV